MPKKTFFNLPEEKRLRLVKAIKDELERVPFSEISINKIVQGAGIPRGSFYQYFEGKDDMLDCIICDYKDSLIEFAVKVMQENNGDIFESYKTCFICAIEFASKANKSKFFQHIFGDIKIIEKILNSGNKAIADRIILEEIIPNINIDILNIKDKNDVKRIFEILLSISKDAFIQVVRNLADVESIKKDYLKKLELLKYGFLKNI